VADLQDGVIFEHGFERGEGFAFIDLARRVHAEHIVCGTRIRVNMRERDVTGLAGAKRERDADKPAFMGIERNRGR